MEGIHGIDLGTTYCVIATINDYQLPEVIENFDDDSRTLASAVYFQEGGDPVIGEAAKSVAATEGDRVVQFVKRYIGKPDAPTWEFDGQKYDPTTISALLLRRMKQYAEDQGMGPVENVVITCPAYFGINEVNATRQAGELAGLNVLDIIHEPTAAALAYCSREFNERRRILVYDLGGGTFDVTLCDFAVDEEGQARIKVIDSSGDDRLGGVDWDERLRAYMEELYSQETGIAPDELEPSIRAIIASQVEGTKKLLSRKDAHSTNIVSNGESVRIEVSREEFALRTADLVDKTMSFVTKILQDNSLTPDDIDLALLVGGSTFMPAVRKAVEDVFGSGKVRLEDPNLAVGKGAAIAALNKVLPLVDESTEETPEPGPDTNPEDTDDSKKKPLTGINAEKILGIKKQGHNAIQVIDILARSFGPAVFVDDDFMIENLIFAGTEFENADVVVTESYSTIVPNQPRVVIPVYENVGKDPEVNHYVTPCYDEKGNEQYTDPELKVKQIGELRLELPNGTPEGYPIDVTFSYGASGLKVSARNPETGDHVEADILSEGMKTSAEMAEASKHLSSTVTTGNL